MLSNSKESPDNALGAVQMFLDVAGDIASSACYTLSSQSPQEFEKPSDSHARLRLSLDRPKLRHNIVMHRNLDACPRILSDLADQLRRSPSSLADRDLHTHLL